MGIIAPPQTIVADSRESFDRLIEDAAVEIDLPSKAAEQAYEKADWRLHLQVCDVMEVTDGYERSDHLVWLDGDWRPDQTKHVAVDATAFGQNKRRPSGRCSKANSKIGGSPSTSTVIGAATGLNSSGVYASTQHGSLRKKKLFRL
jgi:hypothetical protein